MFLFTVDVLLCLFDEEMKGWVRFGGWEFWVYSRSVWCAQGWAYIYICMEDKRLHIIEVAALHREFLGSLPAHPPCRLLRSGEF